MTKPGQVINVLALILAESGAQYFLQRAVTAHQFMNVGLGSLLYVSVAVLYFMLLRSGDALAIANSLWNAGTEISIALLGWFFFGQKLSRMQIGGIVVTIVGINMLGSS